MSKRSESSSLGGGATPVYNIMEIATGDDLVCDTFGNSAVVLGTVYFSPVQVFHACTANGIIVHHGAGVGLANLYVALYDTLNYAPNNRLAVSANTANAGTSRKQYIPFAAAVDLEPGLYWCAMICNSNADTYQNQVDSDQEISPAGIAVGLTFYINATGAYNAPPNPAGAVQTTTSDQTHLMKLSVTI